MGLLIFWYLIMALMPKMESQDEFLIKIHGKTKAIKEDPEVHMNTTQLITSKGYPCEEYDVHTEDGYIIGVQRIPGGKRHNTSLTENGSAKPVVLLQHGLLSCSACWVENLANNSLGFILADAGFDVWLGNSRGSTYSRLHEHLTPSQKAFWNFSFDEMARFDLPATVDKILSVTGTAQLFYIGHSQGGGIGLAELSQDPDFAQKIKLYVGLAPAAYLGNVKSPVRLLMPFADDLEYLEDILGGHGEFLPQSEIVTWLGGEICGSGEIPQFLCENIIFIICGYDFKQLNGSRIPVYVGQHPAGTSVKNILYYAQSMKSGNFQMFDYGPAKNMEKYNQTTPPQYYPGNITIPVALYSGNNDWLVTPTEIKRLVPQIKHLVRNKVIDEWDHLDFMWGMDAPKVCYHDIIRMLKSLV